MKIIHVNTRFTTFPTMMKPEGHINDNIELKTLMNSLVLSENV